MLPALFISIVALVGYVQAIQRIVEHPQNQTVRLSQTVILRCRVEGQKGTLQWVKNGFGLGISRDLPLLDRYSMVGRLGLSEYHLQINNVTVGDDDLYECQLSSTDTEPTVISQAARLSVIVEPSPPVLVGVESTQNVITATEGVELQLSCRSDAGRPPAKLQWVVAADRAVSRVLAKFHNETKAGTGRSTLKVAREQLVPSRRLAKIHEFHESDRLGLTNITSTISFIPTKAEDGNLVSCIASHETYGENVTKSTAVPIEVLYSPKLQVLLDEGESSIVEGGRLVFRCQVDAKPLDGVKIRWSWEGDEKRLISVEQQTAVITDLKPTDNDAHITCRAANSMGADSVSVKLLIPYGPRFTSTSQTQLVQRGDSTTLYCEVAGQPPPEVLWYYDGREDFIAMGKNFTISNLQEWEAGEYKCVATVKGFPPRSLVHHVHLKGPPSVYLSEHRLESGDGATTLSCEARSRTLPMKVIWLHKNTLLDYNRAHSRYQLQEIKHDWGIESKLTIRGFGRSDHGLYNCTAQNDYGVAYHQQEIYQRSLWEDIRRFGNQLPEEAQLAILVAISCLPLCLVLLCCMRYLRACCATGSKGSNFTRDTNDDVIVKCEAIDGAGHFYSELYGSSLTDSGQPMVTDYMSVPQCNPDISFFSGEPAINFANGGAIAYGPSSGTYLPPPLKYNGAYGGNFVDPQDYFPEADGTIFPNVDMGGDTFHNGPLPLSYTLRSGQLNGVMNGGGMLPLEPLPEVATPDSERGLVANGFMPHERSMSRLSTHV